MYPYKDSIIVIMRHLTFASLASIFLLTVAARTARADEAPPSAAAVTAASPTPPSTPEPPTVAPASDPAKVSPFSHEATSLTQPAKPLRPYPALGGHLGFAVPIVTLSGNNTGIGKDFVTVGLTPGITLHLDEKWAIDFEFIAFNELKNTPAATTFVVDPGIIRKFDGFIAGLRVATQVGAPTNGALVPIFVLPFKVSEHVVYFVEGDIPLFLRDGGNKAEGSATFLFQSGFGF
jgi:hypothetical protein